MVSFKIDIIQELKKAGYNTSRLRKEKIMGEATIQRIRNNGNISLDTINTICLILRCKISDVVEIVPSDEEKLKYF